MCLCVCGCVCTECYITTQLHPLNRDLPTHLFISKETETLNEVDSRILNRSSYIFHSTCYLLSDKRNTKNTFVPRSLYIVHIKRILSNESPKTYQQSKNVDCVKNTNQRKSKTKYTMSNIATKPTLVDGLQ